MPGSIASERALYDKGGRYMYVHRQHVNDGVKKLEAAKQLAPELEKQLKDLEQAYHDAGYDEVEYRAFTPGETRIGGAGIERVGDAAVNQGTPAGLRPTGIEVDLITAAMAAPAILKLGKAVLGSALAKSSLNAPKLAPFVAGSKTTGVLRTQIGDVSLISGRAGPASTLPAGTPGFNAITRTHVEGHAAALMRQHGLHKATIYINNPRVCRPCQQNLANMLPFNSQLTIILPDGSSRIFIGNAR